MRISLSTILMMAIAVCLCGCGETGTARVLPKTQGAASEKLQLLGADISRAVEGRTFAWIRARDQATGHTTFANGGGMSWKRLDVKSSGKGSWVVEGDTLCQTFEPTPSWKGGRVCRKLYRQGTTLTTSPNDGGLVTYTPTT